MVHGLETLKKMNDLLVNLSESSVSALKWYPKEVAETWKEGSIVLTKTTYYNRIVCWDIEPYFRPDWLKDKDRSHTVYALLQDGEVS